MYKKPKGYCSRLYKNERREYYAKLDLRNITDDKKFWKTIKPFLTNKGINSGKITLIKNDEILSEDNEVAETLNIFFSSAPKNLGIVENTYTLSDCSNETDQLDKAIKMF